jgi:hypothetical protein
MRLGRWRLPNPVELHVDAPRYYLKLELLATWEIGTLRGNQDTGKQRGWLSAPSGYFVRD